MLQGWSVDPSHPEHANLNPNALLFCFPDPPSSAALSYIQAHTLKLFTHPSFLQLPLRAVAHLVSQPALSCAEDDVLSAVLRYAAASCDEDAALDELLPHVRILSLSTHAVVHALEPLGRASDDALLVKFRVDALARQLSDAVLTRATLRAVRPPPPLDRLRPRAVIAESEHPYVPGDVEMLHEVVVSPWAARTLVEFDRRSCVGDGGDIALYADKDAKVVLQRWDVWRRDKSVKVCIVDGCVFWVGLRSCVGGGVGWGWKLLAVGVAD